MEKQRIFRSSGRGSTAIYRVATFLAIRENGKVVWRIIAESIIADKGWTLQRLFPQAQFNLRNTKQYLFDGMGLSDVETIEYLQSVSDELAEQTAVDYRPNEMLPEDYYAY